MTLDLTFILVILNFILLMIILKKLLYKPLKSFLTDRQNKIQADVDEAKESLDTAKQLVLSREEELNKAIKESNKLKDDIRHEAERKADGWKELLKIRLYWCHKKEVDVSHN